MSLKWRKSSYSGGQGDCVEVGTAAPIVAVRDTKDRQGPALTFSAEAWRRFAGQVKGERSLDLSQRRSGRQSRVPGGCLLRCVD